VIEGKEEGMTCKCIPCAECDGTGVIWYSFSGKYLGNHRCDDLDEMDVCPDCDGSGVAEICDECLEGYEDEDDWVNWENPHGTSYVG